MIFDLEQDFVTAFPVFTEISEPSATDLNFCTTAKKRLVWQFKNKPNIEKYLCVFADEFQELEDAFQQLQNLRTLSTSQGVQIDNLGDIIGVERLGRNDSDYRLAIQNQTILNSSNGEPEVLLQAVKLLTGSNTARIIEYYPARIRLIIDGSTIPIDLVSTIETYAPAGVGVEVSSSYNGNSFIFAPDPGQPPSAGDRGFAEPNYPPYAGLGGALSEIFY